MSQDLTLLVRLTQYGAHPIASGASGAGRQKTAPTSKGKATSPISIDESDDSQSSYKASDVAQGEGASGGSGERSSDEEVWSLDSSVRVLTFI